MGRGGRWFPSIPGKKTEIWPAGSHLLAFARVSVGFIGVVRLEDGKSASPENKIEVAHSKTLSRGIHIFRVRLVGFSPIFRSEKPTRNLVLVGFVGFCVGFVGFFRLFIQHPPGSRTQKGWQKRTGFPRQRLNTCAGKTVIYASN
jgi:hypothetical protein